MEQWNKNDLRGADESMSEHQLLKDEERWDYCPRSNNQIETTGNG